MNYSEGGCPHLMNCPFTHGWKEKEYHPINYKTKNCTNLNNCVKRFCHYLHTNEIDKYSLFFIY